MHQGITLPNQEEAFWRQMAYVGHSWLEMVHYKLHEALIVDPCHKMNSQLCT